LELLFSMVNKNLTWNEKKELYYLFVVIKYTFDSKIYIQHKMKKFDDIVY